METLSSEQFKKLYGTETYKQFGETKTEQPGYFKRVGQSVKDTFTGLKSDLNKQADTIATEELKPQTAGSVLKQGTALARGGLRTVGAAAQAAFSPITEAPGVKQATEFVGNKLAGTSPVKKFTEWSERHPEASKDIMNTLDIASLFGGKAAGQPIAKATGKLATRAGEAAGQAGKTVAETGQKLIEKVKPAFEPPVPNPKQAMGQVLQGKTKDIKSGFRALKEIDTTGVKTNQDLLTKVDDSIKGLSERVDSTLDNTQPVKLKDLKLTGKTTAGKSVSVDYVTRSLEHLKELYKSTGDDVASKNIDEMIGKAKKDGLTRLEVNNIARTYGQEFGEKAFSKMGDALTSVNAQKFENTRKFLKKVARQGLEGKQAQAFDESISSLYRVKDLVKKNADAVTKLSQKIQERGLFEKLGYQAAKVTDLLTGGSLRGIMGGLLPRGVGYKVMNALDLEQSLSRNLEVIQKALKAGDPEIMKLLKKAKDKGLLDNPDLVQ